MIYQHLFSVNLTILAILQTWWFSLLIMIMGLAIAFILHKTKMKEARHEISALQLRTVECEELLNHSKENERKTKEEIEMRHMLTASWLFLFVSLVGAVFTATVVLRLRRIRYLIIPYFFGASQKLKRDYERMYAGTRHVLPERGDNPRPNLLHICFHVLFVVNFCLALISRQIR